MSERNLATFAVEYLPSHPELRARIDQCRDKDAFVAAFVEAGARAGYEFSADEVRRVLEKAATELSTDQLDAVSGGADLRARDQSSSQYLSYELKNVLISSYSVSSGGD